MEEKFFFYLARCNDDSLYSSSTNNLIEREKKHNKGEGSKYTRRYLPIKIVYAEEYNTRQKAVQRELQVKGWIKKKKENLIKYRHPNPNKIKSKQNYAHLT
ncbi:MAG: GIY-YIG nuclease family protein [Candidatus Magasanikbacteria bacterium]